MAVERILPTPEALRTILDVTVHAGECEKVLRAYAEGRLIDGQAIADAWAVFRSAQRNGSAIDISIAGDLLWLLLDALTEEDD